MIFLKYKIYNNITIIHYKATLIKFMGSITKASLMWAEAFIYLTSNHCVLLTIMNSNVAPCRWVAGIRN